MEKLNFGIGFVSGRSNVCKVINNYYKEILGQVKGIKQEIKFTFFILYDLEYQKTMRSDFYEIVPEVYKNIDIKYITPEDIEEEKKKLMARYGYKLNEVNLLLGHGYGKGRNTVMYFAYKKGIDQLLFWDDDEYPIAVIRNEKETLEWKKQNNILEHINNMKEDVDVTIGYHCGYISPIPYLDIEKDIKENDLKDFIEGISNEVISWESIKEKLKNANGVTYANEKIANGEGAYAMENVGIQNAVVGSTLCINMRRIQHIPAFYNPEGARGEDAFFSALLKNTKVIKVPIYHFHDGFLKYTSIMKDKYPKDLKKITPDGNSVEQRFVQAAKGWIKYKPLWLYILDRSLYKKKIDITREKLTTSIPKMEKLFDVVHFYELIDLLNEYDSDVEEHYRDFLETNRVWDMLKKDLRKKL